MDNDSLWFQIMDLTGPQKSILLAFVCRMLTHEQVIQKDSDDV